MKEFKTWIMRCIPFSDYEKIDFKPGTWYVVNRDIEMADLEDNKVSIKNESRVYFTGNALDNTVVFYLDSGNGIHEERRLVNRIDWLTFFIYQDDWDTKKFRGAIAGTKFNF